MSKGSRSPGTGGDSWREKRNYRRIYDENGNVVANIITVDGIDVEVTEEVFRAYSQMDRRERYLSEDAPTDKVLSLEQMVEDGVQFTFVGAEVIPDVADTYLESLDALEYLNLLQKLHDIIATLSDSDRQLIDALYAKKIRINDIAQATGVTRMAVSQRQKRILKKIKKILLK